MYKIAGLTAKRAWAVGLCEGEGCICISRLTSGRLRAQLRLVMLDEDVVRRFKDIVQCGVLKGPYQHTKKGKSTYWKWSVSAWPDLLKVIRYLQYELGKRRQQQFMRVLFQCKPSRVARRVTALPDACGYCQPNDVTPKGYRHHRKTNTPLCRGCYTANVLYQRKQRT